SVLILLHRPYMVPSSLTKTKLSESMPSLNICVSAANSVTHLSELLMGEDCFKYVWCFTTYDIFLSSLIHLTNSASLDLRLQTQARKNLVKMIAYMKNLGWRWFNAAKFASVLEDLMCAHLNFDKYKSDGRPMEMIAKLGEEDCTYPIVLRDQHHPSGGTLLFSPKAIGVPQTPSSTTSTPSSSPSMPSIHNPDLQEIKQEPTGLDHALLQNGNNNQTSGSSTSNTDATMTQPQSHGSTTGYPTAKPKKSRKNASQRNSLLFQPTNTSSSSGSGSGSGSGSEQQQPMFTFASLSTPGMFTQGQAFMDYGTMATLQQQMTQPQQPQTLSQQQQQKQFFQTQPAQPFSVTPLFSSPLALQER
ncbi:hypothetical protein BGZ54_004944, partial [Gamsiella multidivaricata]